MLPYYTPKNFFFADLINASIFLPNWVFYLLFALNALLIWFISKEIFNKKIRIIPLMVYLLSFWGYYLTISHSFYLYLLFAVLMAIYGLVLVIKSKKYGLILFSIGCIASIYASPLLLIIFTLIAGFLSIFKIFPKDILHKINVSFALILTPLVFLILLNISGFKNDLRNEVQIFSDPGLLNTVNRFQGAASEDGFRYLARISENKYLFFGEYSFMKYASQMTPMTFFSPQYKLLGYSFNPPILLGFIIPFFIGLYRLISDKKKIKIIIISTLLVIPSVLAKDLVDLNRLIIFMPVVIYIISYGLIYLMEHKKKTLLTITLILVIFQLVVSLTDIKTHELERAQKYLGDKYAITNQ